MTVGRRKARRQAAFVIYQQDLLGLDSRDARRSLPDEGPIDDYARSLVEGVAAHRDEIDRCIQVHLRDWSLDRLAPLERSILRLGVFELLWERGIPGAVVINEAVELAKRYCSDEAASLVNGVLGSTLASGSGGGS